MCPYGFFDYKYNIKGFESDLFSVEHIVYIVLVFILGIGVPYLFRKARHSRISVLLKVLSLFALVLEIAKISWESYYDITTGRGFNYQGILPIYTCSLFIYTLLAAAWCRGKAKDASLAFLTTISLLYGAIGVVYCNGLNFYPFWTFGAFYSLFFHSSMFITGVLLLMTGYKKLEWKDIFLSFIPIVLLSIIAIPIDYAFKVDYMLLYSGSGVPIYQDVSARLGEMGLRPLYTALMLITHIPLAALVTGIYKLLRGGKRKAES
ncbi:MAG: YwaF family protein [Clostridiales bacterium]|nr:YwaF family protein [Clostridiales bacterium]